MSDRKTPFALSDADRQNIIEARESLIRVRDSVPLVVREKMLRSDGTVYGLTEEVKKRKEFSDYVGEIVADLEWLMGYNV